MADFEIRSYQSILGPMIARILASTDINDLNAGSVILTILEAAASSDFLQEGKLIQLLNLRNIDKTSGADLENLAFEMGVTPTKKGAASANVQITITETAFTKVATNIYAGAVAPAAGDTSIFVVDASEFNPGTVVYIGRNTNTSEAVNTSTIVDNGSYWTINLASPLTKDHLIGEEVVMSQGGDRSVPAGTTVQVPAFGGSAAIQFSTRNEATMVDGEDTLVDIESVAIEPGSRSNIASGKITEFQGAPWTTAAVTNPEAATGGQDQESDPELRQRIKDHVHNLSSGTERAIVQAVIGLNDTEEKKRVVSAFLRKPTSPDDPTILFIDDGTGFEPSFSGVGEEIIVTAASGTESLFQLQQWPVVKAQVGSVGKEPFGLEGDESLYVEVDGTVEQRVIPGTNYRTPGVVTAQEVAETINKTFSSVEARAKDGQLFLTPTSNDPNYIRVGSGGTLDANHFLKFPVRKQYTLRLYKNDVLLEKNGAEAIIQSLPNNEWSGLTSSETLQLNVDGIDSPLVTLADLDFAELTSSNTLAGATTLDWVNVINARFIGVTASAKDDGTFIIKSNKGAISAASISVVDGSLLGKIISSSATSEGKSSDFVINRLLGQIQTAERLESGDELKVGTVNTRGFALSLPQATFNVSHTGSSPAQIVLIGDSSFTEVVIAQENLITFTAPSAAVLRATGAVGQFSNVAIGDYCHIFNLTKNAVLPVVALSNDGSYVDFASDYPNTGTGTLDGTTKAMNFFRTSGLPQLVKLPDNATITASDFAASIQSQVIGITSEVLDSGRIRIRTDRFGGDALGIPSVTGNAQSTGFEAGNYVTNDPHIASIESENLSGLPSGRFTIATDDVISPYINLDTTQTGFTTDNANRMVMAYIGSESRFLREPLIFLSNHELTLRSDIPVPSQGMAGDYIGTSFSGVEFGQADNMVFLIDNDAAKKTFDIPMYVDGTITGPSVPTTTEMDIEDSSGALLGSSVRWDSHRFEDYRIWFQANNVIPSSPSDSSIKITAVPYGPVGEDIYVGVLYPTAASKEAEVSFSIDGVNDQILIAIQLASGTARSINLQPTLQTKISYTGSAPFTEKIQFVTPVDLSAVQVGDIVNITDNAFNASNRNQFKVSSITNLKDFSNAYQHVAESLTATVAGNAITLSSPAANTIRIGDHITIGSTTASITGVTSQSLFAVTGTPFANGSGQACTLTHAAITASSSPTFTVAAGDKLQVSGNVLTIATVYSTTEWAVDLPFQFTGLQTGSISRLLLTGTTYNTVVAETQNTSSSGGIQVYPLDPSSNSASDLIDLINGTAGVKDLVLASNDTGSDGSGALDSSTLDESSDSNVGLVNGQSYVYSTGTSSPAIRLKNPAAQAPSIGDKVRLVPATPRNVLDHFSRKQISGLTVAADVALVDGGKRVQVSSKTPGGLGQVFAIGGRASGQNILAIRSNVQTLTNNRAQIEIDKSSADLLIPGHTVKIYQTGRARKSWTVSDPISSDTLAIAIYASEQGQLTLSVPFVDIYSYSQSGTVLWDVRKVGRNRLRFEKISGTATIPGSLKANDWVLVGDGSSYAGITTDTAFAPANRGWYQVRETDNSKYFDVETTGIEETVETTADSFIFTSYHSARPGDQVVLSNDAPVSTSNKGTYTILSVPTTTSVIYSNPNVAVQTSVALGSAGASSIAILDQGYQTYRQVVMVAPKPSDPTNRSILVVSPGYDLSLFTEGQGAKISLPNRLAFGSDPVPGVSGYSYWTGLKRAAQRTVDGFEPDPSTFPGVGAAGVQIEVREPQIERVAVTLRIKTSQGVALQSIADSIKSAITGYVNSLGLGQDVVMSEIISLVQQVPGVEACVLVDPTPGTERITVTSNSVPRIAATDISLS